MGIWLTEGEAQAPGGWAQFWTHEWKICDGAFIVIKSKRKKPTLLNRSFIFYKVTGAPGNFEDAVKAMKPS